MRASAEFLWRLNQDYVNRLARAHNYLDLLEQLVLERAPDPTQQQLLPTLRFIRLRLSSLSEEHHDWCYTYFYELPESKRVVQSPRAVQRALASFGAMRERHNVHFHDLAALLHDLPPPAYDVTRVPNGDLWDMVQLALHDLTEDSAAAPT